ncbi:hypothetical protein ACMSD3_22395, partial [Bacteroides thetaiotaomicron]
MTAQRDGIVTAYFAITMSSRCVIISCYNNILTSWNDKSGCSVLNKLTLQKSKIKMKYSKKQYNYYSDDERMSYIREYLSSP